MLGRQLPWDSLEVLASAPSVLKIKEEELRNSPTSRLSESQQHGKLHLRKRKKVDRILHKVQHLLLWPIQGRQHLEKKNKTLNSRYKVTFCRPYWETESRSGSLGESSLSHRFLLNCGSDKNPQPQHLWPGDTEQPPGERARLREEPL